MAKKKKKGKKGHQKAAKKPRTAPLDTAARKGREIPSYIFYQKENIHLLCFDVVKFSDYNQDKQLKIVLRIIERASEIRNRYETKHGIEFVPICVGDGLIIGIRNATALQVLGFTEELYNKLKKESFELRWALHFGPIQILNRDFLSNQRNLIGHAINSVVRPIDVIDEGSIVVSREFYALLDGQPDEIKRRFSDEISFASKHNRIFYIRNYAHGQIGKESPLKISIKQELDNNLTVKQLERIYLFFLQKCPEYYSTEKHYDFRFTLLLKNVNNELIVSRYRINELESYPEKSKIKYPIGRGLPGLALFNKEVTSIPWLPDPKDKKRKYYDFLNTYAKLSDEEIDILSRQARAFISIPLICNQRNSKENPYGVMSIDSVNPIVNRREDELPSHVHEALQIICTEEAENLWNSIPEIEKEKLAEKGAVQ
jgi:class 3 adenylate cyclase